MVHPEIRDIRTLDLEPPALPDDPGDCEVHFRVLVGPRDRGDEGDETFHFLVVTPTRLARGAEVQWGRGRLLVPAFDWQVVAQAVAELLARCVRPTWEQCVSELSKDLYWDLDRRSTTDA